MRSPRVPLALAFGAVCAASSISRAQTTRVSVDSSGAQANGASLTASISPDGRYVAFSSVATNLVANDTNGFEDVFARELGVTTLVSSRVGGGPSDGPSSHAEVSLLGVVTFDSAATNLVAGDTNGVLDAFARGPWLGGAIVRVSLVTTPGLVVQGNASSARALSTLGYFAAYESRATNLVPNDVNGFQDVFVNQSMWYTPHQTLASVGVNGAQANADCHVCCVTPGGWIAFRSTASNLVAGDTNGVEDVFVRDGNVTRRLSLGNGNIEANGASSEAALDNHDRRVAFTSRATNLAGNDTNALPDVFVHDKITGATVRASVAANGAQANGASSHPAISADGTLVAFYSEATNLVPNDTNGQGDVFLRDLQAGTTERISVDSSGLQSDGDSGAKIVRITLDGRFMLFDSLATNLVPGDTNSARDIFVRERSTAPVGTYCTAGTSTHGCVPSISGAGTPSATSGSDFTIHVLWVEGQKTGIFFYGVSGQVVSPWASGSSSSLCVRQPLERSPTQNSGATTSTCFGSLSLDWNAYAATHPTAIGVPFSAGQHVFAQAWYWNPSAPQNANLSNALEFVVGP
jgi:hypothetical protein